MPVPGQTVRRLIFKTDYGPTLILKKSIPIWP